MRLVISDILFDSTEQLEGIGTRTIATGLTISKDCELSIDLLLGKQEPTEAAKWKNVFGMQVEGRGRQKSDSTIVKTPIRRP